MDIPDLLYLNRFGFELPKKFQFTDLYANATDSEGEQHLTVEYDKFVKLNILNVKLWGDHFEYVPLEKLDPRNYKPLTVYIFAGNDDVYRKFNKYLKEHRDKMSISIEQDRKLAGEAARYANCRPLDTWTKKTDKPIERDDYWFQYWAGYFEGFESTYKPF